MTDARKDIKMITERMGREAYGRNATSNPFEPYSDRYWWWKEGWDKAKDEKSTDRNYIIRTKISPK